MHSFVRCATCASARNYTCVCIFIGKGTEETRRAIRTGKDESSEKDARTVGHFEAAARI